MPNAHLDYLDFIRLVVAGKTKEVNRFLKANPTFATTPSEFGATRQDPETYFFIEIHHYLYAGDTALHMAAAAFQKPVAEILITQGADCRARNRRGAEPLHYAADTNHHDPVAQGEIIRYLLSQGADPNARDNDGVTPLHRSVRTRSFSAAEALIKGGAHPTAPNKNGSTPLHLAAQSTGRGGTGSEEAKLAQADIIRLLLKNGASPKDKDRKGKDVLLAAKSAWIKELLLANPK